MKFLVFNMFALDCAENVKWKNRRAKRKRTSQWVFSWSNKIVILVFIEQFFKYFEKFISKNLTALLSSLLSKRFYTLLKISNKTVDETSSIPFWSWPYWRKTTIPPLFQTSALLLVLRKLLLNEIFHKFSIFEISNVLCVSCDHSFLFWKNRDKNEKEVLS